MSRCVWSSLFFILLSGVMCADVPLLEPQEISSTFPSSTESNTPTLVTQRSNDGTTGTATTSEPTTPTSTGTAEPTTNPSNVTTVPPVTQHTNATAAPTTQTNATTVISTTQTNATTVISTTAVTSTPAPTTSPAVPNPTVGDYIVRAASNASVCLMAKMGLQFSFVTSVGASVQTVNLDPSPNVTTSEGVCGGFGADATLTLTSDKIKVHFTFSNVTNKFYLRGLNFSVDIGNGSTFDAANSTLSLWEASLGSSYMCRKEQSYNITEQLTLNTFELQVQPFDVTNDKFSTALECSLDDTSLLIPIIVGAALAGLILIVVIAYMIGRRKTYVGYQTL